ncbi:hypothetical protein FQN55_002120 [Onygenales sp. PD_40]|nr:hypothetical protein FQN55_002120 [Onygenales sp. PD_40]KAK2783515.1 hypothetical protein FQN53_009138 [Emmonsiellopsis sp. PD_33]KAK2784555.1 hypothetical protein FQN52_008976 [Onygenales sp. PD_12]KAK2799319.1 hypothetical protein FQN51_006996 [Onygenales sp. PD_10]
MASKRSRAAFEDEQHHAPYAVYGTPLPPLDPEVRDDGSYVPVWKQEVRDDRGRKRLHGAFTGGFSAGYFNTVGSKEGWTPSTFVSSRRDRAKDGKRPVQQQRPEDFMDEEDLREAEESRVLQTAGDYAGFGSTAADATRLGGLMDIFKTSGETMGVKLLKRMGWKEGQGIGPKIRRKANLGDGGIGDGEFHLFAPKNPPMISFIRKTDYKGLGFQAEARLDSNITPESGIRPRALGQGGDSDGFNGHRLSMNGKSSQNQNQPKWGGFGILVPNGTGLDEEEDPYSMGPQISYNRFIDQDKKNKKIPYNTAIPRQSIGLSNPLLSSKPMFISRKRAAAEKAKEKPKLGFRKCHDGRLPLDGFLHGVEIAGLTISSDEKRYAPPEVPKDWKSTKTPSTSGPTPNYVSSAEAAKASSLDPSSRAALLGEAQLPGKSIFDYMTPAGREKIAKATGRKDLPPALGEKGPKGFEVSEEQKQKNLWDLVPKLDKEVAIQALNRGASGWMPYAEDEAKRSRYRSFLEVRAGLRHKLPDRGPDASTDDWLTELREFARAAQVFKPISGLMASRFTSSTASQPKATSDAPDFSDEPLLRKPESKPQDPAEAAAKMGMYGPMTRSTVQFLPSRVLCKRFNVRPSANVTMDPGDSSGGQASGKNPTTSASGSKLDILSKEAVNRILVEAGGTGALFQPTIEQKVEQQQPPPQPEKTEIVMDPESNEALEKERLERERVERIGIGVDPERNEALEGERPGAAVFKAIFGSDDDEDEADEMVD